MEHLTAAMDLFHQMDMQFWFEKAQTAMQALDLVGDAASVH
jgi:hypothetical protein